MPMKRATLAAVLLCASLAAAQDHKFWDRPNQRAFVITAAARTVDAAITCHNLSQPHGHEDWLPTNSCAGATAWIAGGQGLQTLGVYCAHRRRWHKLERVLPYITLGPTVAAISYSINLRNR